MELILWRHAEAEDGYPDSKRELTEKGHVQAERMAAWLNPHLPDQVLILASPARRAQQTAAALGRKIVTRTELDPLAEVMHVLKAVGWPSGISPTVVVGHQPTLGRVAAWLLTGTEGDLSVKKGAIWWLTARRGSGPGSAVVRAVMAPEMLRKD